MNEYQRQLLADEIDDRMRSKKRYEDAIAKLEKQIAFKRARLESIKIELAKLEEGVDW
jgi:hypothetical protein